MTHPYENLANAIITQAVKDWRGAKNKLQKNPANEKAEYTVKECEQFFLSDWFDKLTKLDGELLLKNLQEEYQ